MSNWIRQQWADVRGSVKAAILIGAITAIAGGLRAVWVEASPWELFAVACAVASGWVIVAYMLLARSSKTNQRAKLKIHSAIYGIGNANDVDITETLCNRDREGLWLYIDNNLIPGIPDPAPNKAKFLKVSYSFGGTEIHTIERNEFSELFLPVDQKYIEETAVEYEKKRKNDLALKDSEIASLQEALAQLKRLKAPPTVEVFRTESDITDVEEISIASVDFIRTGIPLKTVSAEIVYVNADDFEVERIPYGEWSGARGPEIDFARDEKRRLMIATKVDKSISAQVGGFDRAKTPINVAIPAVGIRVEIIIKYVENSIPHTCTYVFQLGSTPEGRLRLFKPFHFEANSGTIPSFHE